MENLIRPATFQLAIYEQTRMPARQERQDNTASGVNALRMNTTGSDKPAIGDTALFQNTSGGQNTALGESAGYN